MLHNYLSPWLEVLLETMTVAQLVRKFFVFTKFESLLPCPQQPATESGPEPIQSSLHPQTQGTLTKNFNILFPSMSSLQSCVFPLRFQTKIFFVLPDSSVVLRSPPILSSFSNYWITVGETVQMTRLTITQSYSAALSSQSKSNHVIPLRRKTKSHTHTKQLGKLYK